MGFLIGKGPYISQFNSLILFFPGNLKDSHMYFALTSVITVSQCSTTAVQIPLLPSSHGEDIAQPSKLSKGFCYLEILKVWLLYHAHSVLPSMLSLLDHKMTMYSEQLFKVQSIWTRHGQICVAGKEKNLYLRD